MLGVEPGVVHAGVAEPDAEPAITAPFVIVEDFLPRRDAEALRAAIDAHFAEPYKHRPDRHQIWNYWYVPALYTYLRTSPEKVIPQPLVMRFYQALSVFTREALGLGFVTWPNLSLYVDGCEQHLHNDSTNGRLGFVYSLTRDDRQTRGGDTILLREGDLFRDNMRRPAAGSGLYDLIQPSFNRLTLFDDRMPHGVSRVEGSMDPSEGRIVLHGHVSEQGAFAEGPLPASDIASAVDAAMAASLAQAQGLHGPLTVRMTIGSSGRVEQLQPLFDRVAGDPGLSPRAAVDAALDILRRMKWPAAPAPTEALVPILFGGRLHPPG